MLWRLFWVAQSSGFITSSAGEGCFSRAHQPVSLGHVLCSILLREIEGWAVCVQVEEPLMDAALVVEMTACVGVLPSQVLPPFCPNYRVVDFSESPF